MRYLMPAMFILLIGLAGAADSFQERCAELSASGAVTKGEDGWIFLNADLRYLSIPEFWGKTAEKVSKAAKPEWADPLPAIMDFNKQLSAAGVKLIVMPIPAKAAVYPEFLPGGWSGEGRPDAPLGKFLEILQQNGVETIDLWEVYAKEKKAHPDNQIYCRTDTHWTPYGAWLAAEAVAAKLRDLGVVSKIGEASGEPGEAIDITGDLSILAGGPKDKPSEKVSLRKFKAAAGVSDKGSVMLLGDSHCLVYHAGGDMFSAKNGLPDFLSCLLESPIDMIAVRGSGSTPARMNLKQRIQGKPGSLSGKKAVVWCFAARELTESQGWRTVELKWPKGK